MDEYFQAKIASLKLDAALFKAIKDLSDSIRLKIHKTPIIFAKKNYFKTVLKYSSLLESLYLKLKREKMKAKYEQELKLNDVKEIMKQHKLGQQLKEEINELEDAEIRIKSLKFLAEEKIRKKEEEEKAQEGKRRLLESLSMKAKSRHEEMFKQKKILIETSPGKNNPKYVEMEEKFRQNFEIPELERRKAELAKKRSLFQPISRQDLADHMKKYSEITSNAEKRRAKHPEPKPSNTNLIPPDKLESILETDALSHKKQMLEKRKKYAELVRGIIPVKPQSKAESVLKKSPSIDKPLHDEISRDLKPFTSLRLPDTPHLASLIRKKPKKPSLKLQDSKTPDLKPDPKPDYLITSRKQRESLDPITLLSMPSLTSSDPKSQLSKLQTLEKIISNQEHKIKLVPPTSKLSLALEENLNTLLTDSIKAKLSLLSFPSIQT